MKDYPEVKYFPFPGNDPYEISDEARAEAIEMELKLKQFHYEFQKNEQIEESNVKVKESKNLTQKNNTLIEFEEKQKIELSEFSELEKKFNFNKKQNYNHIKYGFKMNSLKENKHFYKPDAFRDQQRVANEEVDSKLLEFEDYESRLDDDFIGSGRKYNNSYKTISKSFYNSKNSLIDSRKLANDLELKLYEHSRNNVNNLDECLCHGLKFKRDKLTFVPDVDLNDIEMLNMRTEDNLENCSVSIKHKKILSDKEIEFKEFSADSSHVAFLYE